MLLLAEKNPHQLNEFFANLYNNEYKIISLQRQKAKQNWLRLYALKITQVDMQDIYVITGGIIKLTQNREDRKHGDFECGFSQDTSRFKSARVRSHLEAS